MYSLDIKDFCKLGNINKSKMGFLDILHKVITTVAEKNNRNPNVKTASPVVFDDVKKKLETVDTWNSQSNDCDEGSMMEMLKKKIGEAQHENECSTEVETADRSVYDDLLREFENKRSENADIFSMPKPELQEMKPVNDYGTAPSSAPNLGTQAMTNSMGGSLSLRSAPEMGSAQTKIRVPDKTLLRVIQYSDNAINLDGRRSRFVLVDYNGQQGWILENYLNFN